MTIERQPLTSDHRCPGCGLAVKDPPQVRASRWWIGAQVPPQRRVERTPEEVAAQAAFDRADAVQRAASDRLVELEDDSTWERDSAGRIIRGPWRFDSDPRWPGSSRDVESTTADRDLAYKSLRGAREDAATKRRQQVTRDAEARDRDRVAAERDRRATRIMGEGEEFRNSVARLIGKWL